MKISKYSLLAAVAVLAIFAGRKLSAQATVHGKVTNYAGQPFTTGEVKFTREKTTPTADLKFPPNMIFPIDAKGNYTATGLIPGDYYVFFTQGAIIADRLDLTVKPGDTDLTLDDDETRAEYINTLTPEQKKVLADYKAKNSNVVADNAVIANLNNTLKKVQNDLAAASANKDDVSADVTDMKAATDARATEPVLWTNYGNALLAQGDHLAKADKQAGKPSMTDPVVLKTYADAIDAYKKGIELDAASKKPNPASEAATYNQMGNAYAHSGKGDDAAAAFESAVKLAPTSAALYYKNEAVVLLNANQFDQAAAAADKAIAADPKAADPYYIKGQALIVKAAPDKTGKMVAPPGCADAYQMFLQLAPNDPKAADAKTMLDALGEKVQTKFKTGK